MKNLTTKMKNLTTKQKNLIWEIVGYITLALCIFGQIAVGYMYIIAQCAYLVANFASVVRDFKLELPMANKVRDIVFTAITIALIAIRIA